MIVLEGIDGAGKTVQTDLLKLRLEQRGYPTSVFDFPRYGSPPQGHPASYFVRKYLRKQEFGFANGYGPADQLGPYGASLLYAVDRFDAAFDQENRPNLWDWLDGGQIVLSNRYTQSNIGHQASKLKEAEKRQKFIRWLLQLEYEYLKIPVPDLVLLLDMPPEIAWELKQKQLAREGRTADAHEENREVLSQAQQSYRETVEMFPDQWRIIEVMDGKRLRFKEEVRELIWAEVEKLLTLGSK